MTDRLLACKVCGVWQQQSNPAEGCCDGCANDARKLHGHIYTLEHKLAAAEARVQFCPTPERWQEVQAWLAVARKLTSTKG